MNCKHCKGEISFILSILNKGFCSDECKIANEDTAKNKECEEIDFGEYEFPNVVMGGLKKFKKNLQKGFRALGFIIGEEFTQDVLVEDNVNFQL